MRTDCSVFLLFLAMANGETETCVKGMDEQNDPYRTWVTYIQNYAICDTRTDGGGWILLMRRSHPSENFNRSWSEYKWNFGYLNGVHWLGLAAIHSLTTAGEWEVRFDVKIYGKWKYVYYSRMWIEDEDNGFRLHLLGDPNGTLSTDGFTGMTCSNDQKFSTYDKDNDDDPDINCALYHNAGFWHGPRASCLGRCTAANLNGLMFRTDDWDENAYWFDKSSGTFYRRFIEAIEVKVRRTK